MEVRMKKETPIKEEAERGGRVEEKEEAEEGG
jgi:hypothetical protein